MIQSIPPKRFPTVEMKGAVCIDKAWTVILKVRCAIHAVPFAAETRVALCAHAYTVTNFDVVGCFASHTNSEADNLVSYTTRVWRRALNMV